METKYCDCCNRKLSIKKYYRLKGYTLCSKHMHQLLKHGHFLDNIQRTNSDLNDYIIKENVCIINIYNQKNIKVEECIIDAEDLPKVKYNKWRFSHQHIVTGSGTKNIKDISWYILNCFNEIKQGKVVDHINCNPCDNRKNNLRICNQGSNVLNKSFMSNNTSDFIGVWTDKKTGRWCCEIQSSKKKYRFKPSYNKVIVVLYRYIAEKLLFNEFNNEQEHNKKREYLINSNLSLTEIKEAILYVKSKVY